MRFRQLIFWLHLLAGIIAGVVILIMSATGAALAFEKEIIAWSERDARHVTAPADTPRRDLDDLLRQLRAQRPGERPTAITVDAEANTAVLVSFGRTNAFYVDPYSGAVRETGASRVRAFMQTMLAWHRFLGGNGENRAIGKAVTGACNLAFLFLTATGLYLWWPRQWTKAAVRAVGFMNFRLRGKARDWNWHHAIGLWCAPILIALTATALPISYRWAGDLIYKLTGSTPPVQGGATAVEVPTPTTDTKPLGMQALFVAAQKEFPRWRQISYRSAGGGRGGRGEGSSRAAGTTSNLVSAPKPDRQENRQRERQENDHTRAVTLAVVEKGQWPLFSTSQLTLDPFTGKVLRKETFADYNLGRQIRSWTRFLHTGEALGLPGKALATAASAGAVLLVWTGFALAWRRFAFRKTNP